MGDRTKERNWLCIIWGHAIDEHAAEYYAIERCMRCDAEYWDRGPRDWLRIKWWLFTSWLAREWLNLREWWKCSDCGQRFGKHDNSHVHLPF